MTRRWDEPDGIHLDVRGLPPPQPLVAVVGLLRAQAGDDRRAVIVHLERDPKMLYPELAELGWQARPVPGVPGEVRLRLERCP